MDKPRTGTFGGLNLLTTECMPFYNSMVGNASCGSCKFVNKRSGRIEGDIQGAQESRTP